MLSAKALRVAVTGGIAGFGLLMALAMAKYPGGTWTESTTRGYSFVHNFWCDLLHERALNGQGNASSSALSGFALRLFAVTLALFWLLVSETAIADRRLSIAIRVLGLLGAAGLFAISRLPSDQFPSLHTLAVILAGPCGILATLLAAIGLWQSCGVSLGSALAALLIFAASANLVQYGREAWLRAPAWKWLALEQKGVTLVLLAWMLVVSWRHAR